MMCQLYCKRQTNSVTECTTISYQVPSIEQMLSVLSALPVRLLRKDWQGLGNVLFWRHIIFLKRSSTSAGRGISSFRSLTANSTEHAMESALSTEWFSSRFSSSIIRIYSLSRNGLVTWNQATLTFPKKKSNSYFDLLNQLPRESAGCLAALIFIFEDCVYVLND